VVPVSIFYRRVSGLRRGVALGAFLGSFRAISCTLFRILNAKRGRNKTDFVRRFVNAISGWASGMIFSSIDHEVTNAVFVLWVLVRAVRLVVPDIPFSDVLIMMFSASNILSTYVHRPGDNSASYAAFLNKFGGKTNAQLLPFRETTPGPHRMPLCDTIHPDQSCVSHAITLTAEGMQRSIPLYVPVHLGMNFVFVLFVFCFLKIFPCSGTGSEFAQIDSAVSVQRDSFVDVSFRLLCQCVAQRLLLLQISAF
jgi:hypothetical protein